MAPALRRGDENRPQPRISASTRLNGRMSKPLSLRRGDENRPQPGILASTRMNGTSPFPAPSMRELARPKGVTEGVYFGERKRSKILEFYMSLWVNRWHGGTIVLHSLSLAFARQLPQRGSREGPRRERGAWRNHRSRIRSTAPSEREPGWGLHHSTGYSLRRKGTGDFHRPYETQNISPLKKSTGFHRGSDTGWARAPTV